ncbi:intraflagellar transport protein rempA isoform X2 [Dermacentor variabilis]|uniref:intraflagellar transport protein rempA isoform X2 n=2 Tax=Dermacentor variabilis TaxID=34621 RepID=UPI003F5CB32C
MAVYLDCRVEDPALSSAAKTRLSCYRRGALFAVAFRDRDTGGVRLISEDGAPLPSELPRKQGAQVSALSWHPWAPLLALGWDSGEVCVWDERRAALHEPQTQHKRAVARLLWNGAGTRLVSIDAVGTCIGWKAAGGAAASFATAFYHELRDSLADLAFRDHRKHAGTPNRAPAHDGGEEEVFLQPEWNEQPSELADNEAASNDFYVGSTTGVIYFVSENGSCGDVYQMDAGVARLLHDVSRDALVVVTDTLTLAQFAIADDGSLSEQSRFKISGHGTDMAVAWVAVEDGVIGIAAGEASVRLLNLETGETTVLSLPDADYGEAVSCIAADAFGRTLIVGTNRGRVVVWTLTENAAGTAHWRSQLAASLRSPLRELAWSETHRIAGTLTSEDMFLLIEQEACFSFREGCLALQTAAKQVFVDGVSSNSQIILQTEIPVKSLFVSRHHIAVSNGKRLFFYETLPSSKSAKFLGAMNTASSLIGLHDASVYLVENGKLNAKTFQGILKQAIPVSEDDVSAVCLDISGIFLALGLSNGHVRVWDLSRREAKLHAELKTALVAKGHDVPHRISSIKCNCTGNKVSLLVIEDSAQHLSTRREGCILYVWSIEDDSVFQFNFATGESTKGKADSDSPSSGTVRDRAPVSHYWDETDPRLLVCEARSNPGGRVKNDAPGNQEPHVVVVSLFVTTEHGILEQDVFPLDDKFRLMGVQVPFFYLLAKHSGDVNEPGAAERAPGSKHVFRLPMRDFVGFQDCDDTVRDAIMTFSFFMTLRDMDEAFKAIKSIKNEAVWENMARMCVRTKRLDVAKICLGKMAHARGAWSLRRAMETEPELEAQTAILALQLGMVQEAEELLYSCGRYDLLVRVLEDSGQWERAVDVARQHDRIRLRATYHNYGKHLEASGDVEKAVVAYEKADTHLFDVPRMLFDDPQALEQYVRASGSPDMMKWWAQYMESIGEMEAALQFYEAAQDYLSLLRVHCYFGNVDKACDIANETEDRAACFHLARYLENQDNVLQAVHFFARARAFGNAIRVCKENEMDDQLYTLALQATPKEALEAARYFEQRQDGLEKAVTLYQHGGWASKAAELALQAGDLGALQQAAQELGPNADPVLVRTTADRLAATGKHDQAVLLLAASGQSEAALQLCVQSNVLITEELADRLTEGSATDDKAKLRGVLVKIAECCLKQDNYHLAAKKFTQAGDKVQAMRALLKSGDTRKIVFFANVSRQREIYILAANYLQSLDWQRDSDAAKNIVSFYTKARAFDLLASFYESCARAEIEDRRDYEKALAALNEAHECLQLCGDSRDASKAVARVHGHMDAVRKFLAIQELYADSPLEAAAQCEAMTKLNLEPAVRKGDLFAFLVQHYVSEKDYAAARRCLQELQAAVPGVSVSDYVDADILRLVGWNSDDRRSLQQMSLLARHAAASNGATTEEDEDRYSSDGEVQEELSDAP